eukprot:scaffold144182_cov112-Phaeocystis_antarctica.AAC.1
MRLRLLTWQADYEWSMCEHVPMLVHGMGVRRRRFTRQAAAQIVSTCQCSCKERPRPGTSRSTSRG